MYRTIRLPGGDNLRPAYSDTGIVATLASVPWFLVGLAGIAWERLSSSIPSGSFRGRTGYRNVPIDEDAQVLRFEDEDWASKVDLKFNGYGTFTYCISCFVYLAFQKIMHVISSSYYYVEWVFHTLLYSFTLKSGIYIELHIFSLELRPPRALPLEVGTTWGSVNCSTNCPKTFKSASHSLTISNQRNISYYLHPFITS